MRVVLAIALLCFPAAVFLMADRAPPFVIACLFAAIAGPRLLLAKHLARPTITLGLCALIALCVVTAVAQNYFAVKLYPATISAVAAFWCAYTLRIPPTAIGRLLTSINRSTSGLPAQVRERIPLARGSQGETIPSPAQHAYLRGLTLVWMAFFALNAAFSLYTAIAYSTGAWALYNGVASYLLIGLIVGLEILYRPFYQRRSGNQANDAA